VNHVRSLIADDIPALAKLHASVFSENSDLSIAQRQSYLRQVFLEGPWHGTPLSSLVCEDEYDGVVGFLGVIPRPMALGGRSIVVAVGSQFMVAPNHRGLGIKLLKTFLAGPQHLSLTDGPSSVLLKVWKALGGTESPLHSIHWTRPLRPTRYVWSLAVERAAMPPIASVARPLCSALDSLITRTRRSPFRIPPAPPGDELTVDTLVDSLDEVAPRAGLRPVYERESMTWLLEMAERKTYLGDLHRVSVRNSANEVVGWYLCYLKRGGRCEVLQMAGRHDAVELVLDHLFYHAWRRGALAVSGRLQADFFEALKAKRCIFHGGGAPLLVYSRQHDLIEAVRAGDAFLTRLDGEWWMPFQRPARARVSA
jgi:hypothetical protein